jgi:hypothetical protein
MNQVHPQDSQVDWADAVPVVHAGQLGSMFAVLVIVWLSLLRTTLQPRIRRGVVP